MDFTSIWVILKAKSCWAAISEYIRNPNMKLNEYGISEYAKNSDPLDALTMCILTASPNQGRTRTWHETRKYSHGFLLRLFPRLHLPHSLRSLALTDGGLINDGRKEGERVRLSVVKESTADPACQVHGRRVVPDIRSDFAWSHFLLGALKNIPDGRSSCMYGNMVGKIAGLTSVICCTRTRERGGKPRVPTRGGARQATKVRPIPQGQGQGQQRRIKDGSSGHNGR